MTAIEQKTILKEWEIKTIDDVALVLKGKGLSKDKISHNGKYKCILYGQLFTTYNEVIKEVKSRTDFEQGVRSQSGDVLMPGSTTTRAEDLAIASAVSEKNILLGGDINILRKKDDSYDSVFLAYYLTHYKKKEISSFGQGITIIHLYGRDIRKIQLILPPFSEQKKIAKILSTVDCEINKTDEIILKTERLKKGLMQELFTKGIGHKKFKKTKIGNIPEEWDVVKGEDISEIITKGASPRWQGFEYQQDGSLFVTSENVRNGILDINNPKFLPIKFHEKLKNSQLKNDDMLINIVGASIGRSCLYESNYKEANINQAVCLLRPNIKALPLFILQFLQNQQTIKRLLSAQNGSARQNLSLTDIRNFLFILPNKIEQRKIVEILSSADDKIIINKKYKEKFTQLKKGLMQDVLSGGVRVK